MMLITSAPIKNRVPAFYVARVSSKNQVGRPLKEPTFSASNMFYVYCENGEQEYQRFKAAHEAGYFNDVIYGSVQQFIRIRDYRKKVEQMPAVSSKQLAAMAAVEAQIEALKKKADLMQNLLRGAQQAAFKQA